VAVSQRILIPFRSVECTPSQETHNLAACTITLFCRGGGRRPTWQEMPRPRSGRSTVGNTFVSLERPSLKLLCLLCYVSVVRWVFGVQLHRAALLTALLSVLLLTALPHA
jgi:hypothetical protein